MVRQVINVGTVADDGTGDKLRDAMIKVNDNFEELYVNDANTALRGIDLDDLSITTASANTGGALAYNDSTGVFTFTPADLDSIETGVVEFTVTNNGSSAYRFNGGGTTNDDNPTLYLQKGNTYKFAVNASGHPFYLKTQTGTGTGDQYTDGVTNNGTDNGTVTLVLQHDAPDQIYYQCSVHSAMNGTINTAAGSGLQERGTVSGTSASVANDASADLDITGHKGYALMSIQTDRAAWVRVYTDAAARTADASRTELTDPNPDDGVVAEVITTGAQTINIAPGVFGYNNESPITTNIPIAVKNKSGAASTVTVTLKLLQLEA